jgi:hypothetical protein
VSICYLAHHVHAQPVRGLDIDTDLFAAAWDAGDKPASPADTVARYTHTHIYIYIYIYIHIYIYIFCEFLNRLYGNCAWTANLSNSGFSTGWHFPWLDSTLPCRKKLRRLFLSAAGSSAGGKSVCFGGHVSSINWNSYREPVSMKIYFADFIIHRNNTQ